MGNRAARGVSGRRWDGWKPARKGGHESGGEAELRRLEWQQQRIDHTRHAVGRHAAELLRNRGGAA